MSTSNFIISQIIGLVILCLVVCAFQTKNKGKTLWILTMCTALGIVSNALLLNWIIVTVLAINIFRFSTFAILEKHGDKKELRLVALIFFWIITAAVSSLVTILADLHWFNWILLAGNLFSIYGQWAKGLHLIRISNLFISSLLIINAAMFMNLMSIAIEIFVIISIIVFYVKFFRTSNSKKQNNPESGATP